MLIGSLVLVLSAMVIILKTSTPVFNKIFDTKIAPPEDPEFAHNQVQIFVAIIIGALTAIGQFLKYKTTPMPYFKKQILWPLIITILISIIIFVFVGVAYDDKGAGFLGAIYIAIVTSVFAIVGNISYWSVVLKGKLICKFIHWSYWIWFGIGRYLYFFCKQNYIKLQHNRDQSFKSRLHPEKQSGWRPKRELDFI